MIKTLRAFIASLAKRLKQRHVVDNEVSESELTDNDETDAALRAKFVESWDWMERYFRDDLQGYQWLRPIVALIEELRAAGYDEVFRAGPSMTTLILSRSRRYPMRDNQPSISIKTVEDNELWVTLHRHNNLHGQVKSISLSTPSICPELVALLEELESKPIK